MSNTKKVEKESTLLIYNKIKEMILNRDIQPGEKINQKLMADHLNTSRTPVAYSLHKLESEGLVDSRPNAGFYVHRLSINELLDLFTVRESLEILAVKDLVRNASDELLQDIKGLFEPYNHSEDIDPDEYRKTDMDFHTILLDKCSSSLAKKINDSFQIFSRSYTAGLLRPYQATLEEHNRIVDSLIARDEKAAEESIQDHILITMTMLQETIDNLKKMNIDPDKIFVDEVRFSDFTD